MGLKPKTDNRQTGAVANPTAAQNRSQIVPLVKVRIELCCIREISALLGLSLKLALAATQ